VTPQERKLRAQIAAHTRWARCEDRRAVGDAARHRLYDRYERQVDPDGLLDPRERAMRADHVMRAAMARMRLAKLR